MAIELPEGTIAGHVSADDRALLQHATVAVWEKLGPGERPFISDPDAPAMWRRVPGVRVAPDGTFRVRYLAPGQYLLRAGAVASGVYQFSNAVEKELAEGQRIEDVALALGGSCGVHLKVIDRTTGAPLDRAAVVLCDARGITLREAAFVDGRYAPLVTDEAGVISFAGLPPGEYGARVSKPEYVSMPGAIFRFKVVPGPTQTVTLEKRRAYPTRLELTLVSDQGRAPLGGTVEVIVSESAGNGPGATVRTWRESLDQWSRADDSESVRWERELDCLAPGAYQLDALYRRSAGIPPPTLTSATFTVPAYPAPNQPPPETQVVRLRIDPTGAFGDAGTMARLADAMKVGLPDEKDAGILSSVDAPAPLAAPVSLVGRTMPSFSETLGIERQTQGRRVLVCFLDLSTSASRIAIKHIAKQTEELRKENVIVVGVQALPINDKVLALMKWQIDNAFPIKELGNRAEEICFQWGVRELPWLVVSDRAGVVQAEGFSYKDIDREVKRLKAGELSQRLRETRID